LSLAQIKVR